MKENIKPEIIVEDKNQNVIEALKQILNPSALSDSGMSLDDVKDIESIKLIISAIINDELLESLTNLESDELDDINDALYLNEYFDNPRITIFVWHRLKLSRSKIGDTKKVNNLLNIFADISGKSLRQISPWDNQKTLGNRFK